MKSLIWIIVLFAVAVGLVLGAKFYSGDVYIAVEQTLIRIDLHLFAGFVLLAVVLLYVLLNLVLGTLHLPQRMRRFTENRRGHKADVALNRAGLSYFEGKFQQAQAQAQKVLDNKNGGHNKALALLIAAHSADQMDDADSLNRYLQDIAALPVKQQLSRHLLLAESALVHRNYTAAEAALADAAAINPNLTRLVELQLRFAFEQNQPLTVLEKTAKLHKVDAISDSENQQYQLWAYRKLLVQAQDADALKACLKRIPADLQAGEMNAEIAAKYAELGLYPQAVKWVNKYYSSNQNPALLPTLIHSSQYLSDKEQQKAMDIAEGWLKTTPDNAPLLLNLGQMAFDKQLWGKARAYLEASLNIQDDSTARLVLAKILDQAGEHTEAKTQRNLVLKKIDDQNGDEI
ncbi:heme biosynthesis HemY N-terminal domain-containing protein [Stenoxybacter acetivorans]|uniref:heme biosynthesis HemY N-terminal domain-containing protein n=1 Tax=Stenoxybacter acetivorans TaxID=422441 RepID=UPI000561F69F|nr:heme biosynthesis HemY N-terminal domain-containing protein [Stenoxybacter acetivorans]